MWTADGALCLDNPRLATHLEVQAECLLPACSTVDFNNTAIEWLTYIP